MQLVCRKVEFRLAWRLGICAVALSLIECLALRASEPLTNSELALAWLQSREGGMVRLAFDGVLRLGETVLITTNTTVDGTGHVVTLDGGNRVRHFAVKNGATLRLINLTFIDGRSSIGDALLNQAGTAGHGGSIHNSGGTLELIACTFIHNQAIGMDGGPPDSGVPGAFQPGMRGGSAYGGAVYSDNGRLAITNCVFAGNTAIGGSGAMSSGGYTGGGGDAFGGAIYCTNGRSFLIDVTFTNNLAQAGEMSGGRPLAGGGGAYGGALADEGEVLFVNGCVFAGHQALGATKVESDTSRETGIAKGGALFHGSGTGKINDTIFENNFSRGGLGSERGGAQIIFGDGKGGAIYSRGELEIQNSALVTNGARGGDVPGDCCTPFIAQAGTGVGGGIANEGALNIINSTFAGNIAAGGTALSVGVLSGSAYGGAIAVAAGELSCLNVTFATNRLDVVNDRKGFGSTISVVEGTAACTNTILFCRAGGTNVYGTIKDGGHNLCSDETAQFSLPSSRNNVDPWLGPLAEHGGRTPTIALLPASPAIDHGDNSACPPTDQRGITRPMGATCDIGAFELVPQLTLSRSPDGGVRLNYIFRAEQPSRIKASTNLLDWVPLGMAMSDQQGKLEFEDRTAARFLFRFYWVQTLLSED